MQIERAGGTKWLRRGAGAARIASETVRNGSLATTLTRLKKTVEDELMAKCVICGVYKTSIIERNACFPSLCIDFLGELSSLKSSIILLSIFAFLNATHEDGTRRQMINLFTYYIVGAVT